MLTWLLVTFGVALGSSVFPLLSVEVYIVAFAEHHQGLPVVLFGLVIAVGQVLGKLVYFYAARGSLRLPASVHGFVHRKANVGAMQTVPAGPVDAPPVATVSPTRWRALLARIAAGWAWLRVKCHAHPRWMVGATASSALLGVPPFLPTTVLAGLAGLPLRTFVAASLPTRWIRFTLLAASPKLIRHWMHWLPVLHHHLH